MTSSPRLSSRFRLVTGLVTGAAFLFACASEGPTKTKKKAPTDPGDFFGEGDSQPYEQPIHSENTEDSGAFGAPTRPSTKDAATPTDAGGTDAGGPKTYCAGAIAKGDLAIVEIMIASRAGSADDGEWVEIKSTRDCWLKLRDVAIESPRGAATDSVRITEDFELAPKAMFVVADSGDPAKNHGIPGKVFSWDASDVLKNDGDTITVKSGATVIDTLTYPSFSNLQPGRSIAFPDDCPATTARTDWQRWSLTFGTYGGGAFKGTPNATNADVACF